MLPHNSFGDVVERNSGEDVDEEVTLNVLVGYDFQICHLDTKHVKVRCTEPRNNVSKKQQINQAVNIEEGILAHNYGIKGQLHRYCEAVEDHTNYY